MQARFFVVFPLIFTMLPMVAAASDQVSPTVNISISGFTVYSTGSVWYFCDTAFATCTVSGYHNINDGATGTVKNSTFNVPYRAGENHNAYSAEISSGTQYSHCYQANVQGTGSEGASNRVTSGTTCAPADPNPCQPCTPGYVPPAPTCSNEGSIDECGCCLNYSPILVNIVASKPKLSSAAEGVVFDINGLGKMLWVAWPETADDAWVALDRNLNGKIDSGAELFGNATRLESGRVATNGYEALAEFDKNHDGVIDAGDPIYYSLLLWTDANRNGLSDPSEIKHLADAGIVSFSLDYHTLGRLDQWGNRFRYQAKVSASTPPHERSSYDVFPVTKPLFP